MYKGEFKSIDFNGSPSVYLVGDTVLFQGNIYEVIANTSLSPTQSPNSWKFFGNDRPFVSDKPPINPVVGQRWIKDGILYYYYQDADGYSWAEI